MNLTSLLKEHKISFGFTLLLILLETGASILFPLFIGYAINDAIQGVYWGAVQLGTLSLAALIFGVTRRVFDSRFYAKLYQKLGVFVISKMEKDQSSKKSARLDMIGELVEFLENSLPELINSLIGLIGVVIIMASLNMFIFLGSLLVTLIIFIIYWMSRNKTIRFNKSANDVLEKQVDVLASNDQNQLTTHLKQMMKWNIKLSDLEALNFSFSWVVLSLFLVGSIVISSSGSTVEYGVLFALVMYVFQYMESVVSLPFFYQNWLRLQEILQRIQSF